MKKIVILFLLTGLLMACDFDSSQTITYQVNEPVIVKADDFRNSVKVTRDVHEVSNYGKICSYNGYLYVSERGKGIHIINNTDPSNPTIVGFIELTGSYDLFIYNRVLYADAFIDLVCFDITSPADPKLKGRLENAFPEILPPIENNFGYDYALCQEGIANNGIIVGWKLTQRTREIKNDGWKYDEDPTDTNPLFNRKGVSFNRINGSTSRFGLYREYLYTVINNNMSIFNLSGSSPVKNIENKYIREDVETIFNYQDKLFMATPTGLSIYSVEDPENPVFCSDIPHIYSCDPVIVENNWIYVSVRSGNSCNQNRNELIVYDISDIYNPLQTVSYSMHNPNGLGINAGKLFLCDDGLKIFDTKAISFPADSIAPLAHYKEISGYDVALFRNILMVLADNGLYQYDCSDINDIKEISKIPVNK
jgi:hypothetical protein